MNKLLILEFCKTHGDFLFDTQLNRAEFEDQDDETRVQYEGFRPGMYVRIEIENVPCEFVLNFDPHYPIILGGLGNSEGNVGYVQVCSQSCECIFFQYRCALLCLELLFIFCFLRTQQSDRSICFSLLNNGIVFDTINSMIADAGVSQAQIDNWQKNVTVI